MATIDEKVLWGAAEKLRDKCDPADYKNVVLGLVFLKYVSDRYMVKYNELVKRGDGSENDEDEYIADHVFLVLPEARWDYIASFSKSNELGQKIDSAFVSLEKHNDQLKGILPKTYSKSDLDKRALGELVDFFTNELHMEKADGDFFGQVYEYYIGAFATYIVSTTHVADRAVCLSNVKTLYVNIKAKSMTSLFLARKLTLVPGKWPR